MEPSAGSCPLPPSSEQSKKGWKYWLQRIMVAGLILVLCFAIINLWIIGTSLPYLYSDIEKLPNNEVALVLGTSKRVVGGEPNLYFHQRMDAAARLYEQGKVHHILVSGDNNTKYYNEPRDMRIALEKRGIPREAITLDFAGFRTLDSLVRCKEVFDLSRVTVVTNDFHLYRAVFLGRKSGIDAVGYRAGNLQGIQQLVHSAREFAGRIRAFLDVYLLKTPPKFLGPKEKIFSPKKEKANHETRSSDDLSTD